MESLSVKVTLRYVIPSRVLQKWSKEYQPIAPHLFFWMISCYCLLDGSYKLTGETNSFVEGYSHFVGLFLFPNAWLLLGSYPTTWGGSFLSTHMEKKRESMCRLLIKRFLVKIFHHIFDIAHYQGHALAWRVYLASFYGNTMFELSLCQISALLMHFYYQFWSLSQFV